MQVHDDTWGVWGQPVTTRAFDSDACLKLEVRCSYYINEIAPFTDTACAHRMFVVHIISAMCCHSIDVFNAHILKRSGTSGLAMTRVQTCFIITIGIYDVGGRKRLNRKSRPTSGGDGIYNHLLGDADDGPMTAPVRFNPTHQDDAMILRGEPLVCSSSPF